MIWIDIHRRIRGESNRGRQAEERSTSGLGPLATRITSDLVVEDWVKLLRPADEHPIDTYKGICSYE
jgi:hypothetical protein